MNSNKQKYKIYGASPGWKRKSRFGLGGLRTAQSSGFFLQGAELPQGALGGFCLKVRPAVGTVNSDSAFKSLPCCTVNCPSQQMAERRICSAPRLQTGQEPTVALVQYSLRPVLH